MAGRAVNLGAMKLLFVADPLESFKTYKDSTFAMMREAASRGHRLMACEPKDVHWQRGEPVTAFVRDIELTGHADDWFRAAQQPPVRPGGLGQRAGGEFSDFHRRTSRRCETSRRWVPAWRGGV